MSLESDRTATFKSSTNDTSANGAKVCMNGFDNFNSVWTPGVVSIAQSSVPFLPCSVETQGR